MDDLGYITEGPRTPKETGLIDNELRDATNQNGTKQKRSKKCRKSSRSDASAQISPSVYDSHAVTNA
ncbi:hypothetical protein BJ322DRAFT_1112460 [Thelephora terrestris]|uniref:Uncharacterized protein n=1 Tax=Thelephora terrestris TaxID=56493 RepID=A0A9P6L3B0_9AGAM|nr:hypothetical protein BJ322DRAFT_1112460 [Thelephora terrestris]